MSAIILYEWDNAKDERLKKYYDDVPARRAWWAEKIKEGIVISARSFSDNSGNVVSIAEFENIEKIEKNFNF